MAAAGMGAGWIFRGQKRTGLYGVAGDILSVASSDPDVLGVAVDDFSNLTIEAVSPGRSTLTLEATMSRRYSSRPDTAAVEVGAVTFTVIAAAADG